MSWRIGSCKESLKRVEATVTEQSEALPVFRGDVHGAVNDTLGAVSEIASVMESLAGQASGGQSVSPGVAPEDPLSVQAQGDDAYSRLGGVLRDMKIDEIRQRVVRNTETATGFITNFTARFETLKRKPAAASARAAGKGSASHSAPIWARTRNPRTRAPTPPAATPTWVAPTCRSTAPRTRGRPAPPATPR